MTIRQMLSFPVLFAFACAANTGCNKKDPPPAVAIVTGNAPPPKGEPVLPKPVVAPKVEEDTGAVKFETGLKDPKSKVFVSGSEYRLAELDKEIKLKPGEHRLEVRLGDRVLQKRAFTLAKGQRLIVELYDTERHAAEWALQVTGSFYLRDEAGHLKLYGKPPLPDGLFKVHALFLQARKLVTAAGLANLSGLEVLGELLLYDNPHLGDAALPHLKDLKSLRSLHLGNTGVTDAGLVHLKDLTELADLRFAGAPITDQGLAQLAHLTKLKALLITESRITDNGLAHLKEMKQLKQLWVDDSTITGAGLAQLQGLDITQLSLSRTKITDDGLAHLKGMRSLTELFLGDLSVTGAGFVHLHGLPITTLHLGRSAVNDAGLKNLAGLKKLESISFWNTKSITDAGLAALKDVSTLKTVGLDATPITDAALPHLKALTGLTLLNVQNTKMTAGGVAELAKALPKCKVAWDGGTIEPMK